MSACQLALRAARSGAGAGLCALVLALPARADFGPTPAAPKAAIEQRLAAQLPLALALRDAHGRQVRLGHFFGAGRPVVLVLGYYSCPNLCGLLMQGTLQALQQTGLPRTSYRLVGVSIDALDTPASAAAREQVYTAYAATLGSRAADAPAAPVLLVGGAAATARLAQRVGFVYTPAAGDPAGLVRVRTLQIDSASGHNENNNNGSSSGSDSASDSGNSSSGSAARFAHAAGIIIATPSGRISRYLMGVRFEPAELRAALVEASAGHIGTLADRFALLCAHFDPRRGRYSGAVMDLMRVVGALLVLALAAFAWRTRARRSPQ